MNRRRGIGRIEERLAEAIGRAGAGEAFVQKYGTIGNCLVELREGRMTMFRPLVRMPATHRCDPG